MKDTYTTEEAAELLQVTPGRIRQMVRGGELRADKFGRAHVIPSAAVNEAKNRKTKPGPTPKALAAPSPDKPRSIATKAAPAKRGSKK